MRYGIDGVITVRNWVGTNRSLCGRDCRDAIYDVSTGTAETGAVEQNSSILKNKKMQSIANKCGRLSHAISNHL